MKNATKKSATKKTNFLELTKIYSLHFLINKYEIIKNNFELFKTVIQNSETNFLKTLPTAIYLIANISKLSLQLFTSKNKKVIVFNLVGNKKDYEKIPPKNWIKFIANWKKENKNNNDRFYASSNVYFYNSNELVKDIFKFQLLVIKNTANKKDINEVKKYLFASVNDTDCKFNKHEIYLNENSDNKIYITQNLPMLLFGKSYFLPNFDPFLLSLVKLYNLTYSISDKNLELETKKSKKEKIVANKKLLRTSKKLQGKKVSKKK